MTLYNHLLNQIHLLKVLSYWNLNKSVELEEVIKTILKYYHIGI